MVKMPGKKGKKGKSSKKKGKKSRNADKGNLEKKDPMAPDFVPPPPWPGQQLLHVLKTRKVDEKELHGFKVSTRALEKLTPQEIRDLRDVFDVFDFYDKGKLGPPEVRKALKALGFKVKRDQVRELVNDASIKGNGMVNFNEFLDIVIDRQGDAHDIYDEIMQGFKMFDIDDEGRISIDNLKQACREAGCRFSKQEMEEMMEEADTNGDGYVDPDEFIRIMLQTNLF